MTTPHLVSSRAGYALTTSEMRLSKRSLQITLGVIWLIDAILQAQPWMFSKAFGNTIIKGSAMGQPALLGEPLLWIAGIVIHCPQLNVIFMLAQFAIAFGLFSKKTLKPALAASFFWGIGVWYVGDGLGGLFTGGSLMLVGFPTAPILYSIISIALWPRENASQVPVKGESLVGSVVQRMDRLFSKISVRLADVSWPALWVLGAIYALLPSQLTSNALSQAIKSSASVSPGWLSRLDNQVISFVHSLGITLVIALIVIQFLVGIGYLFPTTRKASLAAGSIVVIGYWVFGQALGAITTGQSTDINSAPLFILLALVIFAQHSRNQISSNNRQVSSNRILVRGPSL